MARWWGILTFAVLAVTACDDFVVNETINGETGIALSIEPTTAAIGTGAQITFSVAGGKPPYSFAVASGDGTITTSAAARFAPQSGASPSAAAQFTFQASADPSAVSLRVTDAYANEVTAAVEVTVQAIHNDHEVECQR